MTSDRVIEEFLREPIAEVIRARDNLNILIKLREALGESVGPKPGRPRGSRNKRKEPEAPLLEQTSTTGV